VARATRLSRRRVLPRDRSDETPGRVAAASRSEGRSVRAQIQRGARLSRRSRSATASSPSGWRQRTHRPRPRSNSRAWRSPTCSSRSSGPPCSESCSRSPAIETTTNASPPQEPYPNTCTRSSSEPSQADAEALATAIWVLVHGLAFLHLDGKLDATNPRVVAERITAAVHALLTASNIAELSGPGSRAARR
jgi:hypothetical protein